MKKLVDKWFVGQVNGKEVERKGYFDGAERVVVYVDGDERVSLSLEQVTGFPASSGKGLLLTGLAAAFSAGTARGKDAVLKRFAEIEDGLRSGTWAKEVPQEVYTLLEEALARATGMSLDDARERIAGWDADKKRYATEVEEIARALAEIRAERAARKAKGVGGEKALKLAEFEL